jgi:hypothetical protein
VNLVKVAWAPNPPEAELLQGILRDAGIPSMARRSGAGFEPDFLATGPREILVAEPEAERARQVLAVREGPAGAF